MSARCPGDLDEAQRRVLRQATSVAVSYGSDGPSSFLHATTILVTNSQASTGIIADASRMGLPPALPCDGSGAFTGVTVSDLRGTSDLPAAMYTGTFNGRIAYGQAYGIVKPPTSSLTCDWNSSASSGELATAFSALYDHARFSS
jgi:hypothetical protein